MALHNPIEVPFICHAKYGNFNLPMGSTLFGARSGRGKSATAANILAHIVRQYPNKQSLVLTNEETVEGVFNRVACACLGISFPKLQDGKLSEAELQAIKNLIKETLVPRIKVVQQVVTLERSIAVFEEAAVKRNPPFDLIIVDYLQNIKKSESQPELKESWNVSKAFGDYLTEFGTRYITRVVIFSQLRKNSETDDFQDRIQNDKSFLAHMKVGIEIVPNFDTFQTKFIIHKHRDGTWHAGAKAAAQFDDSKFQYIPITKDTVNSIKQGDGQFKQSKRYHLHQVDTHVNDSFMPPDQHDNGPPQDGEVPF